ncbi:hypothetical protein [Saccharopolyspora hattusasensis]
MKAVGLDVCSPRATGQLAQHMAAPRALQVDVEWPGFPSSTENSRELVLP